MKKRKVFTFFVLLYSFLIITVSCKKENDNKALVSFGHFLIYHEGEQNKPVPSLLIKTIGDTTYLRVVRHANGRDLDSSEFNKLDIWEKDIEDCSVSTYSKFKNILIDYCKNNKVKPNYEYGTFKIDLMDNIDTLTFTMYHSSYTASFFENLLQTAQENNLRKATDRLEKYKNMQIR